MDARQCPVDRQKLLIGLMCCSNMELLGSCGNCPYRNKARTCIRYATGDALAYIRHLEEQLRTKGI